MRVAISREQLINRIRDVGYRFDRRGKNNELYKKNGSPLRLGIPFKNSYTEPVVRSVLRDAGLSDTEIEAFWASAIKQ